MYMYDKNKCMWQYTWQNVYQNCFRMHVIFFVWTCCRNVFCYRGRTSNWDIWLNKNKNNDINYNKNKNDNNNDNTNDNANDSNNDKKKIIVIIIIVIIIYVCDITQFTCEMILFSFPPITMRRVLNTMVNFNHCVRPGSPQFDRHYL